MALKPTIWKFEINLADLDQNVYRQANLTLAQHPSETLERMLVRLLAYCLNAASKPEFCRGLSTTDEPDLWAHEPNGTLSLWIEVGEPSFERLKKHARLAPHTKVYAFNHKAETWWQLNRKQLSTLNVSYFQFEFEPLKQLATYLERHNDISITISEQSLFIATKQGELNLDYKLLD